MKCTHAKLLFLTVFVSLLFGCSKDDDTPRFQEENFLAGYLDATGFDEQTATIIDGFDFERGVLFAPLVEGKITSINVKLPQTYGGLRITIWDRNAQTPIRTELVNYSNATTQMTFDIPDLPLIKDKEYIISMNVNDVYKRSRFGNTAVSYPFTSGNIQILSYRFMAGVNQTFPTDSAAKYYEGDLSFNFLRTK